MKVKPRFPKRRKHGRKSNPKRQLRELEKRPTQELILTAQSLGVQYKRLPEGDAKAALAKSILYIQQIVQKRAENGKTDTQ